MLQAPTLYESMSRLSTQHTEVSGRNIPGHIAMNSGPVFVAVTDFHAVRTYDCSSPETSFVGVSAVSACSAAKEGGGV